MFLGIITSGIIPGTKILNFGVPILEAWILALALYIPLRKLEISAAKTTSAPPDGNTSEKVRRAS